MLFTSGFMDEVMFSYHEAIRQNQARYYVQKSSPGGGTIWTSHNCSVWLSLSGMKSAVYDCLVDIVYCAVEQPCMCVGCGWQ